MRIIRTVRLTFTVYICVVTLVSANAQQPGPPVLPVCSDIGKWSTETFVMGGDTVQITTPLLLTDGRVMIQYRGGISTGHTWQDWYALTPSKNGCYSLNSADCGGASLVAVWNPLASIFSTIPAYGPIGFASAVLPNGNVIVEGGEYNLSTSIRLGPESASGAYYNATLNKWTKIPPPSGWTIIGDAPSVVLPDGTYMLGNACGNPGGTGQTALLDEATRPFSWTNTRGLPQEWTSEASFTLLPDNSVLTVGTCWPTYACTTIGGTNAQNYMLYDPTSGIWSSPGNTPATLYAFGSDSLANSCTSGGPAFGEQGPAALLPNGTYFATGGFQAPSDTVLTSVYDVATQKWRDSPPLPSVTIGGVLYPLGAEDQGSVVLRDGNYLLATVAGNKDNEGVHYIEWNGNSYCQVNTVPAGIPFQSEMLTLPTGQILITDVSWGQTGDNKYFIYTPGGTTYPGIAPTLTSLSATTLVIGSTYTATGTQFNGATQSSFFGDDFQNATNYPLVRITNNGTHHVFYAKTHDPSTMGVATGNLVTTTSFDVPSLETGASTVVVVTNGIVSNSLAVTVEK